MVIATNMDKVNIVKVRPDPDQPRKDFDPGKIALLKKSIEKQGIINPLIVEKVKGGDYVILDGERRYRVAKELGMKEVPIKEMDEMSPQERIITQFEIQEQHESWKPIEKALAIERLAEQMKVPFMSACKLLSINERTSEYYLSFLQLMDKERFTGAGLNINWASPILRTRNAVRRIFQDNEEEFPRNIEKALEKGIIDRIQSGEISSSHDITKIKDSLVKKPAMIKEFIETEITPDQMFVRSKAKGAFHLRNIANNGHFLISHFQGFAVRPDVKVPQGVLDLVKKIRKEADDFLKRFGDLDN